MSDPLIEELRALVEEHDRFMNGLQDYSPSDGTFAYYLDLLNRIARTTDASFPRVEGNEAADVLASAFRALGFAVFNWCVLVKIHQGSRTPVADVLAVVRPRAPDRVSMQFPFRGPVADG